MNFGLREEGRIALSEEVREEGRQGGRKEKGGRD